jgi:hypothetical protein
MHASVRRIMLIGTLLCVLCLAYFYLLDLKLFPTAGMAGIFIFLLRTFDIQAAWLGVGIGLLAMLWRRSGPILWLVDLLGRRVLGAAIVLVILVCLGTVWVYRNHPFSMDEYAAVFQAKIFASGHITAQLPPQMVDWLVVPGFNGMFLLASHASGQAIESYLPGYSLLLAPFFYLGIPWLCNALLAGLALVLIHRMTLDLTGDRHAAGWATLFALASGAFLANAISFYSMQAHLTANLLFAWLLFKPTNARAVGAGLVGSLALALHNPFPHVLFAAPWFVALAVDKDQRRYLVPLLLAYLPLTLLLGGGWLMLRSGIAPIAEHARTLGDNLSGAFHWPDALISSMRLAATVKLWVWAVPCLLVFAGIGARQGWSDRRVRLLSLSAALTFCGYLFVTFDQGHGWGYRYFHSAWGVIPILAATAMARTTAPERLVAYAGALSILSLLLVVPLQMWQIHQVITWQLAHLGNPVRPGNNIYFVNPNRGFYMSDTIQIDPQLRDQDLVLATRGKELDEALILRNWPQAVNLISDEAGVALWNLGPLDQRRSEPGKADYKHFVFDSVPQLPAQ